MGKCITEAEVEKIRRLVNDNKTVKEIMKATGRSKNTVLKFSKLIEDWVSTEDDLPQKDPKFKNLSIEVEVKIKKSGNKTTAIYNDKNNQWFSTKTMKVIEVDKWRTATTLNNRQE